MKVVLFSGGFDSTFVLYQIARDWIDGCNEKYWIDDCNEKLLVVSVKSNYSGKKTDREILARKNIIDYMKKEYPMINFEVVELGINHGEFRTGHRRSLTQPITWIDALITSTMFNMDDNENIDIYLSYINGDHALSHKEDVCNLIKSSFNILFREPIPQVNIHFPLQYTQKDSLIEQLLSSDIGKTLYSKATTCEDGFRDSDNCGRCIPCMHLKDALIKLATSSPVPKIQEIASQELQSRFKERVTVVKISDE